ncbi:MAG: C40 family peptidase [Spirochaetes bacterium]|nr:C40 family peptidase [Spirochaetota bacterium]MBN2772496.1 C40 family peptidase [Spirochaetota bacterium]
MRKFFSAIFFLLCLVTFIVAFAQPVSREEKTVRMSLIMIANKCVGIGYQFNGTTPKGFDNAGFVLYVYQKNGITLPRTVKGMFGAGDYVDTKDAKPGDLLFFMEDPVTGSSVNHVGIYLGKDKFVHMPGEGAYVRIERLVKDSRWSARFAGVRSYHKLFDDFTEKSSKSPDKKDKVQAFKNMDPDVQFETSDM